MEGTEALFGMEEVAWLTKEALVLLVALLWRAGACRLAPDDAADDDVVDDDEDDSVLVGRAKTASISLELWVMLSTKISTTYSSQYK